MFKQGKAKAFQIFSEMLDSVEDARLIFSNIRWSYSDVIPKQVEHDKGDDFQWMGLACPMTDGSYTIIISKKHHKDFEEIALTIGHELAHVLQYANHGHDGANHDDEIFETFRQSFCEALEFEPESF